MKSDRSLILVISHDPVKATHRCCELALAGWGAVHAEDLLEGMQVIKTRNVHLLILHLPAEELLTMDLPDVVRRIEPSNYLPIMILAEHAGQQQRCGFLNSGVDDVVSAQVSPDEMIARVRSLLRAKELNDQLAASRAALQQALSRERMLLEKLREDNAHLQTLATTDPLTRVQNVRSFGEILGHSFRMAKRYTHPLSLLILDLDHFKLVNDTYGHPSGDYVLKELAVILKRSVRESDVVARVGGEEFSIILPKADRRRAVLFAARIRREIQSRAFNAYGRDIRITASVGAASYPDDALITEPQMLLYFADQALLAAKESGRDRVVQFRDLDFTVQQRLRRQYAATAYEKPGAWPVAEQIAARG